MQQSASQSMPAAIAARAEVAIGGVFAKRATTPRGQATEGVPSVECPEDTPGATVRRRDAAPGGTNYGRDGSRHRRRVAGSGSAMAVRAVAAGVVFLRNPQRPSGQALAGTPHATVGHRRAARRAGAQVIQPAGVAVQAGRNLAQARSTRRTACRASQPDGSCP